MNNALKNKKLIFLFLFLLYLSTRIFFLFSVNLYDAEECRVGTIAKEFIVGPNINDYLLPFHSHYTGRIFQGFFTYIIYSLFGENGLYIKIPTLIFSLLIFILVYLFLHRFFSEKAAIICSLLLIFSLPVYTIRGLSQGGPHIESVFFDILIMFIFYEIFFSDNKCNKNKYLILFGLISGFAIFINIISLLMIFNCLLFWFIFDKMFFIRKKFCLFFSSFILGLSPFIYYNLTHSLRALYFSADVPFYSKFLPFFSYDNLYSFISKFINLFLGLPRSFIFKDFLFFKSTYLSYLYYLFFISAFIYFIFKNGKSILKLILQIFSTKHFGMRKNKLNKEIFILFYIILFFLVYLISDFKIYFGFSFVEEYRFFIIIFLLIIIVISLFLSKLNKKILFFSLTILILLGLIGNLNLISLNALKGGVAYAPYCYDQLGQEHRRYCDNLKEPYKHMCYYGYSKFIKARYSDISRILIYCDDLDEINKTFCYESLGEISYKKKLKENKFEIKKMFSLVNKNNMNDFCRGVGYSMGLNQININTKNICYEKYPISLFEGFGKGTGLTMGVIPLDAIERCNKLDKKHRPYCFKGLGWSFAEKFGDNPSQAGKFAKYINEDYKIYFYEGTISYINLIFGYNLSGAEYEIEKLENNIYNLERADNYLNISKI